MQLIITRPQAQAADWVAALTALGCQAQALPLIGIAPATDLAAVRAAWLDLADCALVMFVSANAVQHFFQQQPPGQAWPAPTRAGSTGPGTSAALRAVGVPPACIVAPETAAGRFDSEALWQRLQHEDWTGRRARVVRGEEGRDWLADTLRKHGAAVDYVAAYRRQPPTLDAAGAALLATAQSDPATHLWAFSSSEALGHLQALAPGADWSRSLAVASHPRIAGAAQAAGFGRVNLIQPTVAALQQAVQQAEAAAGDPAKRHPAGGSPPIQSGP